MPLFLEAFALTGNVSESAKAAGVGRSTVYDARESDKAFAAAWDEAEEDAADRLERVALERAVDGVAEPVYYKGQLAGAVRRYSDTLLIFLLKARRPEKFRERYDHQHSGSVGITLDRLFELAAQSEEDEQ